MFEGRDGRVCDAWSLQTSNCLLLRFVCCLSCLLNIQLGRGSVFVVKGFEVGGGGCYNDRIEASFQGSFRQQASCDCILYHRLDARFGCYECSEVCWSRDVSPSPATNSG